GVLVVRFFGQGAPTFIFRSRFHEPISGGRPPLDDVFSSGSTPASNVIAVTRAASPLLVHERITASPGFSSAGLRAGRVSSNDCTSPLPAESPAASVWATAAGSLRTAESEVI